MAYDIHIYMYIYISDTYLLRVLFNSKTWPWRFSKWMDSISLAASRSVAMAASVSCRCAAICESKSAWKGDRDLADLFINQLIE